MLKDRPARGRLHVRGDEEPDWDESHIIPSDVYFAAIRGLCLFCGHSDHRTAKCPFRPQDY